MFGWSARRPADSGASVMHADVTESLCATRVLPKFLAALAGRSSPVLVDLGPVVGPNVSFFGDRLSCQLLIEDFDATRSPGGAVVEAIARLADDIRRRAPEGVDGILCWDVFDRLDRPAARAIAAELTGLLKPKSVIHGFFGTTSGTSETRTRFVIQSETGMKWRVGPAEPSPRHAWQSGEIPRLFGGVAVVDSVLLASATREVLLRKA